MGNFGPQALISLVWLMAALCVAVFTGRSIAAAKYAYPAAVAVSLMFLVLLGFVYFLTVDNPGAN